VAAAAHPRTVQTVEVRPPAFRDRTRAAGAGQEDAMQQSSGALTRRLAVAVALIVGLLVAALPASAAPSTKNYSASLSLGGATGVQKVFVPGGVSSDVLLVLTNREDSQQAFGSAEVTFAKGSLPSAVSVSRPGWTVQPLVVSSGARYRLVNSGMNPVPAGASLEVTVTMPGAPTGTTDVTTRVKQSNDFNGTNNDFTLVGTPTQPLQIVTDSPCAGSCTPPAFTSEVNGVRADLTVTSSSAVAFTAGFTTDRLSCDTIPFGTTVKPEPFQVATDRSAAVSKTIVLTFPKALANLVPNNGTPNHPVCAGGDFPFPGSSSTEGLDPGTFTHPFEGLLLNCSDPAYVQAVAEADPDAFLPMCVSSRARNAGKLIVTISIQTTTVDPRVW
jgi:hypothetical protein